MWIINPLVIRFSPHLGVPARPFTPEVLRTMERTPIPSSFVVFTLKSVGCIITIALGALMGAMYVLMVFVTEWNIFKLKCLKEKKGQT